jgi:hypothetical protein
MYKKCDIRAAFAPATPCYTDILRSSAPMDELTAGLPGLTCGV